MTKTEAVDQLESLVRDRESFIHGEEDFDSIFKADIEALKFAISEISDSSMTAGDILRQLAEEAAELAQAALKLDRAIYGRNPTSKSYDECLNALTEEFADVLVCVDWLQKYGIVIDAAKVNEICDRKSRRWEERLRVSK